MCEGIRDMNWCPCGGVDGERRMRCNDCIEYTCAKFVSGNFKTKKGGSGREEIGLLLKSLMGPRKGNKVISVS
jgi:hypothetical protein